MLHHTLFERTHLTTWITMRQLIIYISVVVMCIHESQVFGIQLRSIGPVGPVERDSIDETPVDTNRRRPIRFFLRRSCGSSSDCRSGYTRFSSCCRDSSGELIDADKGWEGPILSDPLKGGTCSFRKSGPGEFCNDTCGCIKGYECYRTVTGVCCPPLTCWKKEDAKKDKDKWSNCKPPTCFFPP